MQGPELIVGLDIGTTKICTVVGEVAGGDINIIGIGSRKQPQTTITRQSTTLNIKGEKLEDITQLAII